LAFFACVSLTTATASALPRVQIDPADDSRVLYTDDGTQLNTDSLVVSAVRIDATITTTYTFIVNATVAAVAPCTQTTSTTVTCVVDNATGASIDLGNGEGPGAPQSVRLEDGGWAGQTTVIAGGDGDDVIRGGAGDDTIVGRGGADDLYGLGGTDIASYAGHTQPVRAALDGAATSGAGCPQACEADLITADIEGLIGGAAGDVLIGNAGVNDLRGEGGDDVLRGGLGIDRLDGGAGVNTADYSQDSRTTGIEVELRAGTQAVRGGAGEDRFVIGSIQNVTSTSFSDLLSGDDAANTFSAGDGDDRVLVVDGKRDLATCGAGADVVEADDVDVLDEGCETVTRKPTSGGGGGEEPPVSPCADPDSCGAFLLEMFEEVFGCNSVESCSEQFPPPPSGDPPAVPCADPPSCGELVVGVFEQVFGCDSVESCGEQFPAPGGGEPPCADPVSCGAYLADVFGDTVGCNSVESCAALFPDDGEVPPPPAPAPCADPASCGSYFASVFEDVFGCDSAESCEGEVPDPPPPPPAPVPSPPLTPTPAPTPAPSPAPDNSSPTTGSSTSNSSAPGRAGSPASAQRRPRARVRVRIQVRRDRVRPFYFTVRGAVRGPAGQSAPASCAGRVKVVLLRAGKVVGRASGRLNSRCGYSVRIRAKRAGRLRMVVRFTGNKVLAPSYRVTRSVRAG
jgi:hypothetical protein